MSKPLILILKNKLMKKTLYENNEGSTQEISLSKNSADFDYVEITAKTQETEYTFRVKNPNGKIVDEEMWYPLGSLHVKIFSRFAINGNKITPVTANCGYYSINYLTSEVIMNLDQTNYFNITKVVGGYDYLESEN